MTDRKIPDAMDRLEMGLVHINAALAILGGRPLPGPASDSAAGAEPTPAPSIVTPTLPMPESIKGRRAIPWGQKVSAEFIDSALWIEDQLGLKTEYLMPCMMFESGLNPKAKNPQSTATGLIQFMEATAKRLGTTTAALAQMSGTRQLAYVYKYFREYADRGFDLRSWSLEDTYMAILWPAGIGKPMEFSVFAQATRAYEVNKGLDLDKDGFVTKREATEKIRKLAMQGLLDGNVRYI